MIQFTHYERPNRRVTETQIDRSTSPGIEEKAAEFIKRGGRFTTESGGMFGNLVSICAEFEVDGETMDIVTRVVPNGPAILAAVDEVVTEANALTDDPTKLLGEPEAEE